MATVLDFPHRPPARRPIRTVSPRALPSTAGRRGEYALADVARPLGLLHRPIRAIIDALRVLAVHKGMPLPRTPRIVSGVPIEGARAICQQSRWDAGEFDAWLEGNGPAGPAAACTPVAPPLREEMAKRAAAIGAGR